MKEAQKAVVETRNPIRQRSKKCPNFLLPLRLPVMINYGLLSKYHAVQSIAVSVVVFVLGIVVSAITFGFGGLCFPLVWLVFLYWAYKAYQGEYFEIPWLTGFIKGQGWI